MPLITLRMFRLLLPATSTPICARTCRFCFNHRQSRVHQSIRSRFESGLRHYRTVSFQWLPARSIGS
jgi:hypothetical protein